jgi:hypothetical protein
MQSDSMAIRLLRHAAAALATLMLMVGVVAPASNALAKQQREFEYPYEYIWNTLVRFIRVDAGFPIKDRDIEAGYILFEYQDQGRAVPGTAEVLKVNTTAGARIRVVLQIPSMPSYIETMLLHKLSRKLLEEYGEPPRTEKSRRDRPKQDTLPDKSRSDSVDEQREAASKDESKKRTPSDREDPPVSEKK